MAILHEYYRPGSVDEALELLAAGKGRLALLAGGTRLVGELETRTITNVDGVVDLRDTGLNTIRADNGSLHVGAMCTLSQVSLHPALSALAGGLLLRAARGEGPLNLRNVATVGGIVACAEYDSEFYAALLALNASLVVRGRDGTKQTLPLADFELEQRLIVEIRLPDGPLRGGAARIARTPSDRPIVAAFAVRDTAAQGDIDRVALCGVAPRPVLAGSTLNPPDDFKGSARYRLAMSEIVVQRARAELERDQ